MRRDPKLLAHILALLLLFPVSAARAQQDPVYNQYMLNAYLLNPAVVGYEGVTEVMVTGREQWVGYAERPRTYALSFQMRLFADRQGKFVGTSTRAVRRGNTGNERRAFLDAITQGSMGVGAYIFNDINGRMRRTGIQGSYAYHITANDLMYSLGISLSLVQYKVNILPEDLYDPQIDDPLVMAGKQNTGFAPDGNVGFMISNEAFFAGISVNSLFQNSWQFGRYNRNTAYRMLRQYHVLGGYRFHPYRSNFGLEPSVMAVMNERLHWAVDVNFRVYYKSDYWAGLSFRTLSNLVFMFGMRYKQLIFGYAFDYAIIGPRTIGKFGSHELMVGLRFGSPDRLGRTSNRF